jgi:hydrogenase nickel incorporation protein HypB
MCATCGCSGSGVMVQLFPAGQPDEAGAAHSHAHQHHDDQRHAHGDERTVMLEQKLLAKNDRLAEFNRDWLRQRAVLAVNLMSSPGAGKTTLLERTARDMAGKMHISVIEGDQAGALDAKRIRSAGCRVVQINTGAGCHLDAEMVAEGLRVLDPPSGSLVVIENVGSGAAPRRHRSSSTGSTRPSIGRTSVPPASLRWSTCSGGDQTAARRRSRCARRLIALPQVRTECQTPLALRERS